MGETHATRAPLPSRVWVAFAVIPVADAFLAFVGFPLMWSMDGRAGQFYDPGHATRAFAVLTGFLGLLVTLCGAIPVVVSLSHRGPVSLGRLLTAGVMLGNAPFLLYVIGIILPATLVRLIEGTLVERLVPVSDLLAGALRVLAVGSAMGAWSALVFWVVGIWSADSDQQRVPPGAAAT